MRTDINKGFCRFSHQRELTHRQREKFLELKQPQQVNSRGPKITMRILEPQRRGASTITFAVRSLVFVAGFLESATACADNGRERSHSLDCSVVREA